MNNFHRASLLEQIWIRKIPFFLVFYTMITLTYGALYALDFYPEPKDMDDAPTVVEEPVEAEPEPTPEPEPEPIPAEPISELPTVIRFDSLDREVAVLNPSARSIAALDAALLKGVVRHPDSADFSEPGNMFILGHSSYLPNVMNKNFQAFNGLQKLAWGDTIRVYSDDTEYVYRVDRVYEAKASEVIVPMSKGKAKLTLATCNSFGSKDDRFMVEATLINTIPRLS